MTGDLPTFYPFFFKEFDEKLVKKAVQRKGGSGPSGLNLDGWIRILLSNMMKVLF